MHISITLPLQQLRRPRIYSKEYMQRIVLLLMSTSSLTLLLYFPTAPCKSSHGISVTGHCAQYLIVAVSYKINKQTDQFKLPLSQNIVTEHSFNSRYSNICDQWATYSSSIPATSQSQGAAHNTE